jgi:hypothetical protein
MSDEMIGVAVIVVSFTVIYLWDQGKELRKKWREAAEAFERAEKERDEE